MKEENDGSISEVISEPPKKPRGRPRKIKIVQEEEPPKSTTSNISDITEPELNEPIAIEPIAIEPIAPEPINETPVKRPRGRPKKMKLIIEE